jgi:biopolymer transport protein ExbD
VSDRAFHRLRRYRSARGAFAFAPLVDVVMLLLIFLLISARFDRSQVVEVDLPRVPSDPASSPASAEGRVITLAPDGSLAWNGRPVTRADLARILAAAPPEERLLPLVIQGDTAASLGDGLGLLEFLRGLGHGSCVFQVRGEGPGSPQSAPRGE